MPPSVPRRRLRWQDAVSLLALPLSIAGLRAEDTMFVIVCFALSVAVVSFSIATDDDLLIRYRIVIISTIVVIFSSVSLYMRNVNLEKELSSNEGVLLPGNDNVDTHDCLPPDASAVGLYIGPHTFYVHDIPQRIITISGKLLLAVKRQKGSLVITTLRLYPEVGDIFARIDENGFWVSPGIRKKRPDLHTLIICDGSDEEALNIRYANPRAIQINGIFHYEGKTILIRPNYFQMDGFSGPGGVCSKNAVFSRSIFNFD